MEFLKSLATSKKAVATLVAILMTLFGKKMGLDEESLTKIVGALMAYIVGQGIADAGKEAVKEKEAS